MASGRSHISGALKAAVAASVLGIAGLVAAPSASASVITVELVPTSASNGVVTGQTVTISGPGTINFNIVAVLHSQNSTQTDDGVSQMNLSIQSDTPAVLGTMAAAVSSGPPSFQGSTFQNGTPTNPNGSVAASGPDIGSDRAGAQTTSAAILNGFFAQTPTALFAPGTATTSGDLTELLGTGTFSITTLGSTNVVPVYHNDTNDAAGERTEKFTVDGVSYSLNGDGHGAVGATTVTDTTLMNTQGFSVVATPEPGSLALLGLGGLGLLMRRRRK